MQTTQQLQSLQEDLGRVQNASSTLRSEDKERQARLTSEIEERERAQQELHQLKKQIAELDNSLEIARQEMVRLRSRSDEEESRWRHREQELIVRLEDSRGRERKLEDQKHNLEVCLADATQQIQELKVRARTKRDVTASRCRVVSGTFGRDRRPGQGPGPATAAAGVGQKGGGAETEFCRTDSSQDRRHPAGRLNQSAFQVTQPVQAMESCQVRSLGRSPSR